LLILERRGILPSPIHFNKRITLKLRTTIVDWLHLVCDKCGLLTETYFIAVYILDRILGSSIKITATNLKAFAIASLSISAKKQEIYPPDFGDYIAITSKVYTKKSLIQLEQEIFLELNGDFNFPGPLDILRLLTSYSCINLDHHSQSKYFLELATITTAFQRYLTSVIATACHYIVCKINDLTASNIFDIPDAIIKRCANDIIKFHNKYSMSVIKSITKKYKNNIPKRPIKLFVVPDNVDIREYSSLKYSHKTQNLPQIIEFSNLVKIEKLGEGHFGKVKKFHDNITGTSYAMKKVHNDYINDGICSTHIRETCALLLSKENKNIVSLKAISHNALLLECMDEDLSGHLKSQPQMEWIIEATRSLLEGLQFIHDYGMMHRDIKPHNILVSNGHVKIADFGLSRGSGITLIRALTNNVCTMWYRPPELLLGAVTYDQRIDIWSLGCTFYEMVTNNPLFDGSSEIDQLHKIFRKLGTPTENTWPSIKNYKNYNNGILKFPNFNSGTIKCPESELMEYIINVCTTMAVSDNPQNYERLFAQDVLAVFDLLSAINNKHKPSEVKRLFLNFKNLPLSTPGRFKLLNIFETYSKNNNLK
jgi:serine/threonine protein kinase